MKKGISVSGLEARMVKHLTSARVVGCGLDEEQAKEVAQNYYRHQHVVQKSQEDLERDSSVKNTSEHCSHDCMGGEFCVKCGEIPEKVGI